MKPLISADSLKLHTQQLNTFSIFTSHQRINLFLIRSTSLSWSRVKAIDHTALETEIPLSCPPIIRYSYFQGPSLYYPAHGSTMTPPPTPSRNGGNNQSQQPSTPFRHHHQQQQQTPISAPHPVYPPMFFPVQANVSAAFSRLDTWLTPLYSRCRSFQWPAPTSFLKVRHHRIMQ